MDLLTGDGGSDTILVSSGVAERDQVFMDLIAGDAPDTLQGFSFGVGPDADSLIGIFVDAVTPQAVVMGNFSL